MTELVSAAEAASLAAAQYVYSEAYKRGLEDGWAEGWAAAFSANFAIADPRLSNGHSCVQSVDDTYEDEEEEESDETLELAPEWAKFFASREGERRRATAEKAPEVMEELSSGAIDLGGGAATKRKNQASMLYGVRAEEVLKADAAMEARFCAATAETPSPFWPVVALSDLTIERTCR